jgi:hypothetical protein
MRRLARENGAPGTQRFLQDEAVHCFCAPAVLGRSSLQGFDDFLGTSRTRSCAITALSAIT